MANPTAGDYYIIPVVNTGKALDVSGNDRNNGANVQIYAINRTDAQVWRLSYRSNGTAQITSRFTGKSLDIPGGNLVSGANVQMWTDNDTRAQEWTLSEKSTVTVDGTSYATYEVYLTQATTLCMDVYGAGSTDGTNVWVYTRNNTNAQRWAFVPVLPFRSGGIYEVKSTINTGMNVDIAGGSTTNGANCQIYPDNDTNAQKFIFTNEGNGWSIRNVASGKYVDVSGANFRDGTNVQSYENNGTRAQRWSVTTYGTQTVSGVNCQIVALGAANGSTYYMDVTAGIAATNKNIQIYHDNDTRAQRFVLYPTWAVDPHMPAPYSLGFPGTSYGPLGSNGQIDARYYPQWSCADAWATSGPNSYQWRYRYRYMKSSNSSWEAWGSWTAWTTAQVTRSGVTSKVTQGLPVAFSLASRKCCQIQFEVRTCGVDELSLLYGATSSCTGTFYYRQNVTLGSAAWSPEGIRVACSTDYPYGSTNIYVKSVKWGNKEHMVGGEVAFKQLDDSTSFLIPQSSLDSVPSDGQQVTLTFDYGSDQCARWGGVTQTRNVTVSLDSTEAETVTFEEAEGRTLVASVTNIGTTRMWIVRDGLIMECPVESKSGSLWRFRVAYPFNCDYAVVTAGTSSDGERFYVDRKDRHETGACHAWTLADGTSVAIELREGTPLTTDSSVDALYDERFLNAREWGVVSFSETRKGKFTVEGAVVDGKSEATYADIEALVGEHASYRSPSGDICDVAVLSCSRKSHREWSEVSVTMAREAV